MEAGKSFQESALEYWAEYLNFPKVGEEIHMEVAQHMRMCDLEEYIDEKIVWSQYDEPGRKGQHDNIFKLKKPLI